MSNSKSYIHYGANAYDCTKFEKITNKGTNKPNGGLWSSPVQSPVISWHDWCEYNDYRTHALNESFEFDIDPKAKILTIESDDDLNKLDIYDLYVVLTKNGLPSPCREYWDLDFEQMALDWDGIKVSITTSKIYFALYGWDCDTLLIFNPEIIIL